jgi:hypothetical protein
VWSALNALIGQTRDFPINWEGCGSAPFTPCPPVADAPPQGTIYQQGNIDKYDIIGFGSMTIQHVYGSTDPQVQGTPAQDYVCNGKVQNNTTILPGVCSWFDLAALLTRPCQLPPSCPWIGEQRDAAGSEHAGRLHVRHERRDADDPLPQQSNVNFSLHMNATFGACGTPRCTTGAPCASSRRGRAPPWTVISRPVPTTTPLCGSATWPTPARAWTSAH